MLPGKHFEINDRALRGFPPAGPLPDTPHNRQILMDASKLYERRGAVELQDNNGETITGYVMETNLTSSTTNIETSVRIWTNWNSEYIITHRSNTNSTSSTSITYNNSTTNSTSAIWGSWNENYVIRADQVLVGRRVSEEQRRRWREQDAERQRRYAENQRKIQEANERAEILLKQYLNSQQRDEYEQHGLFHVYIGDKKYRIKKGWAGNVELIDESKDNRCLVRYCIHPRERIPYADNLLAQKLMLESNEQEFLRIANATRMTR